MSQFGKSEIVKHGYWAVPHKATRRSHTCRVCKASIEIGDSYYAMAYCCGVQPYPDKVHTGCLDAYYDQLAEIKRRSEEMIREIKERNVNA